MPLPYLPSLCPLLPTPLYLPCDLQSDACCVWSGGCGDASDEIQQQQQQPGGGPSWPLERLAVALIDGRATVLSVRGRSLADTKPAWPAGGPTPADSTATALAAVWPLVLLGGSDGSLLCWDVSTGRCSRLDTGVCTTTRPPPLLHVAILAVRSCDGLSAFILVDVLQLQEDACVYVCVCACVCACLCLCVCVCFVKGVTPGFAEVGRELQGLTYH